MARTRSVILDVTVAEMREHAGALMEAHWQEVARNKELMKLDPNWDAYHYLEDAGMMFALGAFVTEGGREKLVGYSVNFVQQHMHYKQLRYGQNDLLFIGAEHRGGSLGMRLIRESEKRARELGCQMFLWHAKDDPTLKLKDILPKLGYGVQDIIFSRAL